MTKNFPDCVRIPLIDFLRAHLDKGWLVHGMDEIIIDLPPSVVPPRGDNIHIMLIGHTIEMFMTVNDNGATPCDCPVDLHAPDALEHLLARIWDITEYMRLSR